MRDQEPRITRLVGRRSAKLYLEIEEVVKKHVADVHPNERFETVVMALMSVLMLHVIRHMTLNLKRLPTSQELLGYLDKAPFHSVAAQILLQLSARKKASSERNTRKQPGGTGPG